MPTYRFCSNLSAAEAATPFHPKKGENHKRAGKKTHPVDGLWGPGGQLWVEGQHVVGVRGQDGICCHQSLELQRPVSNSVPVQVVQERGTATGLAGACHSHALEHAAADVESG